MVNLWVKWSLDVLGPRVWGWRLVRRRSLGRPGMQLHGRGLPCVSKPCRTVIRWKNETFLVKASLGLNLLPFCLSLLDTGSWAWGFFWYWGLNLGLCMLKCSALDLGCANVCWGVSMCIQVDFRLTVQLKITLTLGVIGVHPPYLDPKFWCVFVFVYFWAGVLLCNRDWPGTHK